MYTRLIKRPVAQIAQIDQLFQHFNLICAHGDTFYWLCGMLMSKDVNNDVSRVFPIPTVILIVQLLFSLQC